MAILSIPDSQIINKNPEEIRAFMNARGIYFDQWKADVVFDNAASQDEILNAYQSSLKPFMEQGGYQTADVISIHAQTENYEQIRAKFLAEHTHSEDEIRFFVDG
ncbi:MAG TPA: cupin, partial [Fluviicola sp.]|nr:cupin [Fluviicola sp.]